MGGYACGISYIEKSLPKPNCPHMSLISAAAVGREGSGQITQAQSSQPHTEGGREEGGRWGVREKLMIRIRIV